MVGNGVDAQDLPGLRGHNDLGTAVLLAAMARAGVAGLVLASSMVVYGEGRYACPEHGDVAPRTASRDDLDAGRFDPRCPHCDGAVAWAAQSPRTPRPAAQRATPCRRSPRSTTPTRGQRSRADGAIALRYHNVYGPDMPADTPYAGVAAIFRSALERGEAPPVFEDGGRCATSCTSTTSRWPTSWPSQRSRPPDRCHPVQHLLGRPHDRRDGGGDRAEPADGRTPVVTGHYRAADVRHVVASPDAAVDGLGFRAEVRPEHGLARLATDPLRTR